MKSEIEERKAESLKLINSENQRFKEAFWNIYIYIYPFPTLITVSDGHMPIGKV